MRAFLVIEKGDSLNKAGGLVKFWGQSVIFFVAMNAYLNLAWSQGSLDQFSGATSTEFPPTSEDLALPPAPRPLIPLTEQDTLNQGRSPFSYNFFNWTTVNAKNYRDGDGQFSSYNFVGIDYRLNYDSKVSFRPIFFLSSAGKNFFGDQVESDIALGDAYFQYSHYNIALLPGDIGVIGMGRVYVPLSDASKVNGMLSRIQGRVMLTKMVGRGIELAYHFYPSYFFYSRRGTTNYFDSVKGNKQAELEHFFELSEILTTQFGLSQRVGVTHEWLYDVPSARIQAKRDEFLNVSLMASYDVSSVNFRAGVINDIKLREYNTPSARARKKPLQLFREEELQYSLMTYVRF